MLPRTIKMMSFSVFVLTERRIITRGALNGFSLSKIEFEKSVLPAKGKLFDDSDGSPPFYRSVLIEGRTFTLFLILVEGVHTIQGAY